MAASNAVRVCTHNWESGDVIRTPSTIGRVEGRAEPILRADISCDWYQATMQSSIRDGVLKQLTSAFGEPEVRSDIPKEMGCYRECLQFPNGVRFYHSNRYTETSCLVISGSAKPSEYFPLLKRLIGLGVKTTRLDLAFDDRRGVLPLDAVYGAVKDGSAVSRWKEISSFEKTMLASGRQRGRSLQFGSRQSASYLVTYDKGLETGYAEEGEWVRWELRLANSEAEKFVAAFMEDAPSPTSTGGQNSSPRTKATPEQLCYDASDFPVLDSDISPELVERFKCLALHELKSRLSFRERTTALNVTRAKQLPWWESFLEYCDPPSELTPDEECIGYEGGQSLNEKKKKLREVVIREQVEETLTEVYEEHIRSHASNRLEELVRSIPEYGDPTPRRGAEGVDEIALAFVGLHPSHETMVIPFPTPNQGASKQTSKKSQPRLAEVVTLPVRRP